MKKYFFSVMTVVLLTAFHPLETTNYVVDNFEDGNMTNLKNSYWFNYQDPNSTSKLEILKAAENPNGYCAVFDYSLKSGESYPYTGFGVKLIPMATRVDISAYAGIRFKAKGKGTGMVQIETEETSKQFNHYSAPLVLEENWKTYEVPFSKLKQNWGASVAWNPAAALSVNFAFNEIMGSPTGKMYLDDLEFYIPAK